MILEDIHRRTLKLADKKKAAQMQKYFKTGKGQYAEGDLFWGISVPELRELAKDYAPLINLVEISILIKSEVHEKRLLSLLFLVQKYKRADQATQKKIYEFYIKNTEYINNWDLVDLSAYHIVGAFLFNQDKDMLYVLAESKNIWERRIAMIATYHFIKQSSFNHTLRLAKILVNDPEDLIHKAVGWMLRELGKKDLAAEERFLKHHYQNMPRTMLRYAIEKFPKTKRLRYLNGKV